MSEAIRDPELTELLRKAMVDQDQQAFDQLFASQSGRLRILLHARIPHSLRARVDVDDIIQETYIRAFQRFSRIPDVTPEVFRRWIVHIALRELKRVFERNLGAKKRDAAQEQRFDSPSQLGPASGATPSSLAGRRESSAILAEVLDTLPRDYREVILLRDFEGCTSRMTAQRLNRSPGAIDVLYHRALLKLGAMLAERGLSASRY